MKCQILNVKCKIEKKSRWLNTGFTLMELLVVIAIMAILVSLGTVSYSNAQKKSRDSKRKADIKSIQNAMEQYFADNSSYDLADCDPGTAYLPGGIPKDPKTGSIYTATADWNSCTASAYCVCAALEGETNTVSDCTGDQGSLPTGYSGFYCVKNLQ